MTQAEFKKKDLGLSPEVALNALINKVPVIFLGGPSSEIQILITDFKEVCFEDFQSMSVDCLIKNAPKSDSLPVLVDGYVGLLSYDDFCNPLGLPVSPAIKSSKILPVRSRVFQVQSAVIFHSRGFTIQGVLSKTVDGLLFGSNITPSAGENLPCKDQGTHLSLDPTQNDEEYLSNVNAVLNFIEEGRFYQLNMLRYFSFRARPSYEQILKRFFKKAGSQGAIFRLDDESVFSFSPERFIKFRQIDDQELELETWPIKGTRQRSGDPLEDQKFKEELKNSSKDNAELHMIVDLMRNDLNRLSAPHSVEVIDTGSVVSFESVHHLVAKIKSRLKSSVVLGDFFRCLLPAGSITGAPKIEVMNAITELEGRRRGRFMGNAFYLSSCGRFDSSVLIRTIQENQYGDFEYAAGSGLVIKSNPTEEMQEINTKCEVLSSPL